LEVGAFIGPGNELGRPIPIGEARGHVFGLCLVNDWSARDIQKWEYQPLGPFLAKNFGTTVSPFVVTMEALEPFRCPAYQRPEGDPRPLPYLFDESDQASGGFDITLEVSIASEEMRKRSMPPLLISKSNAYRDMYWTISQMVAHHSSNGCNLQPGDLLASGTVSGRGPTERGCLLEATWQGNGPDGKPLPRRPIELPTGETATR
jgi:fumarylacetoacetase